MSEFDVTNLDVVLERIHAQAAVENMGRVTCSMELPIIAVLLCVPVPLCFNFHYLSFKPPKGGYRDEMWY